MNPYAEVGIWLAVILVATFVPISLYEQFGWFKFFYHDVLHWHKPDDSPMTYNGCSLHAKCKYCGKEIMQDSQGNWF